VAIALREGSLAQAPSADVRAQHLAAMADTMRATKKRKAMGRLALGVLVATASAAAAAALVLLVGRGNSRPTALPASAPSAPFVLRGTVRVPMDSAGDLAPNDHLHADAVSGAVSLRTGSRLSLRPHSNVVVQEMGARQAFLLTQGGVEARVAKVSASERFLILTGDTEVEVRGTAFDVHVGSEPACGTLTRVHVSEGVVVVRPRNAPEIQLRAGQSYPSCEQTAAPAASTETSSVPSSAKAPGSAPRVPVSAAAIAASGVPVVAASELAEQNDLFAAALAARRQGRNSEALHILDTLRGRHPRGTLSESVDAERLKILARTDKAQARVAAREYIKKHPGGPSTHEAATLLEQDSP